MARTCELLDAGGREGDTLLVGMSSAWDGDIHGLPSTRSISTDVFFQ
jgi:hypothetical protein